MATSRSLLVFALLAGCAPWSDSDLDGDGVTVRAGDCDDADPQAHPGATDFIGDGVDNNCDGVDGTDTDGDGEASVTTGGFDCDDANNTVHPDAVEICDGTDNDCDEAVDNDAVDAPAWYPDGDGDGYGDAAADPIIACSKADYLEDHGDCDDVHAAVHPDALDQCGQDFDCDGQIADCAPPLGELTPADADWTFVGEQASDWAGESVAAGDLTGDGVPDLVIGAPWDATVGSGGGAIYVVQGPLGGGQHGSFDLANADRKLWGDGGGDQAGISVAAVGNLAGFGADSLLVGANLEGSGDAGAAYLFHSLPGADGALSQADAKFIGENVGDHAGRVVRGAGDVDGDGRPDLLVAAHLHDTNGLNDGAVYLISATDVDTMSLGEATVKFVGEIAASWTGWDIDGNQDFDGDGVMDMVFGAPYGEAQPGTAYLELGTTSGIAQTVKQLSQATAILHGEVDGDMAGAALAFVGDTDGDGRADLALGAPGLGGDGAGGVYLLRGVLDASMAQGEIGLGESHAVFRGGSPEDHAGNQLSEAGDVDGDGFADFLVGCLGCEADFTAAGVSYLLLGPASGDQSLEEAAAMRFQGASEGDLVGASLAGAGDLNADGYADFLVGSPQRGAAPFGAGSAYLFMGGDAP